MDICEQIQKDINMVDNNPFVQDFRVIIITNDGKIKIVPKKHKGKKYNTML